MGEHAARRLWPTAAAALAIFLLTAGLVAAGAIDEGDRALLFWAARLDPGPLAGISAWLTHLGSVWILVPVVVFVAIWAQLRGRKAGALVFVGGALLAQSLVVLFKWLGGRERPEGLAEILPATHAFPSGHATMSTVIYGLAAFLIASIEPRARTVLAVVVPLLCLAIGATRIFLGVHWPSDVVGGFAFGVFLLALGKGALDATTARDRGEEEGP